MRFNANQVSTSGDIVKVVLDTEDIATIEAHRRITYDSDGLPHVAICMTGHNLVPVIILGTMRSVRGMLERSGLTLTVVSRDAQTLPTYRITQHQPT